MAFKVIYLTILVISVARCGEIVHKKRSAFGEHSSLESAGGLYNGPGAEHDHGGSSDWSSFGTLGLGHDLDHGGMFSSGIDSGLGLTAHNGLSSHALSSGDLTLGGASSGFGDGFGNELTFSLGTDLSSGSLAGSSFLEEATGGFSSGIGGGLSSLPTLGVGSPIPLGDHVTLVRRIGVPVPHPVLVAVPRDVQVPVPHPVPVPVDRPVPRPVPQPYPVPVVRHVPVPVEQNVAVPVAQPVPVPVYRPVAVPVARPVPVPVVSEVPVPVYKPVPVYAQQRNEWQEKW